MKTYRASSFMLALLLASAVFAGCGEAAQSSPAPGNAAPADGGGGAQAETEEETTSLYSLGTIDVKDYGGRTFRVITDDSDPVEMPEQTGDIVDDAQYKRNLAVEELLGVKIETVKADSVDRQINGQMLDKFIAAGDASIDAAFVFGMNFASLMSDAGKLQNLLGFDTLNVSSSWWNQNFVSEMTLRGTLKGVTGSISIFNSFAPELYFFNKNMAESFGINDLYSLADSGQWTFDKAVEYSGLVASDIDGDGKMTENDRFGTAIQPALVLDCVLACGERLTKKDGDSIELALNTPRTARKSRAVSERQAYQRRYKHVLGIFQRIPSGAHPAVHERSDTVQFQPAADQHRTQGYGGRFRASSAAEARRVAAGISHLRFAVVGHHPRSPGDERQT